ncbi:hypothetical protein L9F63_009836, partial [Diploptera punctata]
MEESIYSTIWPIFNISKALGLAPFTYMKRNHPTRETKIDLTISRNAIIHSLIMCVIVFVAFSSSLITKLIIEFPHTATTSSIANILLFSSFSINSIITLILTVTINKHKMKKMLATIYRVDKMLFNNYIKYHKTEKHKLLIKFIMIIILVAVVMISDCIVWSTTLGIGNIPYYHYYLDLTIDWLIVVQYMYFVILVKDRFKLLNIKLINLFTYEIKSVNYINLEEDITLSVIKRNSNYKNGIANNWTQRDLLQYNLTHELLCDVSMLIISIYEVPIFIGIFCSFLSLTLWLYFSLCYYFGFEKNIHITSYHIITNMFMSLLNLVKFSCITLPSYAANNEVSNIAKVLRKLLLIRGMDKAILDELQRFSYQSVLRQFKFTALGFLNLDLSLFCSIIGALLTYLVILMQFKVSEN